MEIKRRIRKNAKTDEFNSLKNMWAKSFEIKFKVLMRVAETLLDNTLYICETKMCNFYDSTKNENVRHCHDIADNYKRCPILPGNPLQD